MAHWDACGGGASCLNLRNAKVANLQDDERAWPARITLEGFTYTHLGGAGGEQRQDMRNRPIAWWRDWLLRDPVYSAQPYAQLAAVLAAAGNRDGAAEIRFFSRDRQRSELLRGCRWLQALGLVDKPGDERPCEPAQVGGWCGLSALQVFVGYGIGGYGFRAVGWALVFSLIGMVTLCFAPGVRGIRPSPLATRRGPRQKSLLWCFGAASTACCHWSPSARSSASSSMIRSASDCKPGNTLRSACSPYAAGRSVCLSSRRSRD